jgi:hypothetical protein
VWTTKNWAYEKTVEIFQNHAKLSQEHSRAHTVFLDTPKWLFISGPDQLAHAKKRYIWRLTKLGRKNESFAKSKQPKKT